MSTGRALIQYGVSVLGKDKRLEAELLLASVLQYSRAKLLAYDNEEVTEAQSEAYLTLVARRLRDEPLQYLTGIANFMGMDFKVTPDVLIPRFDTEILVEQACLLLRGDAPVKRILDLCTGSGAIAVSLAKNVARAEVWASDLSPKAVAVAEENAAAQQAAVQFVCGDLFKPFEQQKFAQYFQMIVSNPPYITSDEFKGLPSEVRKEPTMALWGGADGLKFYRDIAQASRTYLANEGHLAVEIGFTQGQAVQSIMTALGFRDVRIHQDWQGHDRVVAGQWIIH